MKDTRKLGPTLLSRKAVRELVKVQLADQNTPRSLSIFMIMENTDKNGGVDDEILNLKVDPFWFQTAEQFIEFSNPTDLVRKATFLMLSVDPTQVAREGFLKAEQLCAETNRRLSYSNDPTGRLGELLHQVRKNIRELLPDLSHDLFNSIIDRGGWGSGSTSSSKRPWLSSYHKLKADQHATPALLPLARQLINETRGWNGNLISRPYSKVAFVAKNAKTDRAIAVEPSMNSFIQRGFGCIIRDCLKKWGVNLHSQERNRQLARIGSLEGTYSTIDLSMASDTIAFKAIKYLLPSDWATALEFCRTPYTLLPGDKHPIKLEKWSSMGNGYTFELETLIFSAIVRSCVRRGDEWAVYGDDIVVPTYATEEVANLLHHLGFLVNQEKSFTSGPFRESCGADFFLGTDVRGFYLKEIKPDTPFVWANWLRVNSRLPYRKAWWAIVRKCKRFATFVPYGDHGLSGFFSDPGDMQNLHWITNRRPFGPVIGFSFEGWSYSPLKFDLSNDVEDAMIIASISYSMAREAITDPPFAVTATAIGRWRRRRAIFTEDCPWLRPV